MDNTVGSRPAFGGIDPVTTEVFNQNSFEFSSYYTPTSLTRVRNIAEYISGYIDGEGCFSVTFNKKSAALLGWESRPSFSVSQNEGRRQVIDIMKEYFQCGYIRRDYSDKTLKFEVRNHEDLMQKIIPHFEKFPFLSDKQKDFMLFNEICNIIDKNIHLTKKGFTGIVKLAYQMNGSGKRKRTTEEIIGALS